ncbi:MAG: hypothetical protein PHV68_01600 [Candidatus Gastranaerophilales bacterium]|nr:hypothetical protein [Candidatus Gastranaerophilales bacterium]
MFKFIILLTSLLLFSKSAYADQADFYIQRAKQKIQYENYQGAIEDLTKASYMAPNNLQIHILQAQTREKTGNFKAAVAGYDFCINLVSTNTSDEATRAFLLLSRARAKKQINNYQSALEDLRIAQELYKEQNDFQNCKKTAELINIVESCLNKQDTVEKTFLSTNDYVQLAKEAFKKNDFQEAILKITKALEVDSSNPLFYKIRAMSKANLEDYEGALLDFQNASVIYQNQNDFNKYEKTRQMILKIKNNQELNAKEGI